MTSARFRQCIFRTTDVAAARAFYRDVLGHEGDGIVELPAAAIARGARPHWLEVLDVSGLPLAMWPGSTEDQLNLRFANLSGLVLDDARLSAASVAGALAERVSFRRADLRLALLCDARLDGADFEGAHLDLADFSRASLRGACLRGVTGASGAVATASRAACSRTLSASTKGFSRCCGRS